MARSIPKSVNGIEEIHEISKKLEEEHGRNQEAARLAATQPSLTDRIAVIEAKIQALQEMHDNFKQHYQEFVKATVSYLKESSEE